MVAGHELAAWVTVARPWFWPACRFRAGAEDPRPRGPQTGPPPTSSAAIVAATGAASSTLMPAPSRSS
jgi:hypothetical protein